MSNDRKLPCVDSFSPYAQRDTLNNELHSRPFVEIVSPSRCTTIAMLRNEDNQHVEWETIRKIGEIYGISVEQEPCNHLILNLNGTLLKWERHTEFSSYTFIKEGINSDPFNDTVLSELPSEWIKTIPGELLIGVHLYISESSLEDCNNPSELEKIFDNNNVVGSLVSSKCAAAFTDFKLHHDGFSRFLIKDIALKRLQAGRLLQRLWEIETYRMMALLSMSSVEKIGNEIANIEEQLSLNINKLADDSADIGDQSLLSHITNLAANIEQISAKTSYRYKASKAYYTLVIKRGDNLKESRIEGLQTITSFLYRRLGPAMRTVKSLDEQIASISRRVNRASNLLQTKINTVLQIQNKELLKSMNKRAQIHLKLQQTVEGLSVVAISYYSIGIVNYICKALLVVWPSINFNLLMAIFTPSVLVIVLYIVHRTKKELFRD